MGCGDLVAAWLSPGQVRVLRRGVARQARGYFRREDARCSKRAAKWGQPEGGAKEPMQRCVQCGRQFSPGLWAGLVGRSDVCPECRNAKKEAVRKYVQRLEEFGRDRYLDAEEQRQLEELKRSLGLREDLGLTGDDIAHTVGELLRLKRLTAIKNGQLPVVEADIMLKRGRESLCRRENRNVNLASKVGRKGLDCQTTATPLMTKTCWTFRRWTMRTLFW